MLMLKFSKSRQLSIQCVKSFTVSMGNLVTVPCISFCTPHNTAFGHCTKPNETWKYCTPGQEWTQVGNEKNGGQYLCSYPMMAGEPTFWLSWKTSVALNFKFLHTQPHWLHFLCTCRKPTRCRSPNLFRSTTVSHTGAIFIGPFGVNCQFLHPIWFS